MRTRRGTSHKRSYPAHFYRRHWSYHDVTTGILALATTALLCVTVAVDGSVELALACAALFFWLVFGFAVLEKRRMHLCVDRRGVEIGRSFHALRIDWPEMDHVWLSDALRGRQSLVIRQRHSGRLVLVKDYWDDDIESVHDHIWRYRQRYAHEFSSGAPGAQLGICHAGFANEESGVSSSRKHDVLRSA
jgi:hypothetical protein